MVMKTTWNFTNDDNWCFVGAQPEGSRSEAVQVIRHFLTAREQESKPWGLFVEGVWGIGKTSTVLYALQGLSGDEIPPYVFHVTQNRNQNIEVEALRDNREWGRKEYILSDLIKNLDINPRERKLIIMRENGGKELKKVLEAIRSAIRTWGDLRFIFEIYPYSPSLVEDIRDVLEPQFLFDPTKDEQEPRILNIQALQHVPDNNNDEINWLISGCPSQYKYKECAYGEKCSHSKPEYVKNLELLTEVFRWAGTHPYALRIVSEAVDKYYDPKHQFQDSTPEQYIRKALNQKENECYLYRDTINELIRSLSAELGNYIPPYADGYTDGQPHALLSAAGVLTSGEKEKGQMVIKLLRYSELPPPPPEEYPHALKAMLELVYWWWLARIQPLSTRQNANQNIQDFIKKIGVDRVKKWFGNDPIDEQGRLEQNESTKNNLLEQASVELEVDPEWGETKLIEDILPLLKRLLRTTWIYGIHELEPLWSDHIGAMKSYESVQMECSSRDLQTCIADKLVMEASRRGKLPDLIAEMRKPA